MIRDILIWWACGLIGAGLIWLTYHFIRTPPDLGYTTGRGNDRPKQFSDFNYGDMLGILALSIFGVFVFIFSFTYLIFYLVDTGFDIKAKPHKHQKFHNFLKRPLFPKTTDTLKTDK